MGNRRRRKARRRIKVRQSLRLKEKNDATRVASRVDTINFRKVEGRPPASVAPVFKVKLKKKL